MCEDSWLLNGSDGSNSNSRRNVCVKFKQCFKYFKVVSLITQVLFFTINFDVWMRMSRVTATEEHRFLEFGKCTKAQMSKQNLFNTEKCVLSLL